jgi:hypothetical protein
MQRRPGFGAAVWAGSVALSFLAAGAAQAVDGVVEINQARALAGGISSGDSPGFPVGISESGSYRLTGNLVVPGGTGAPNLDAILIVADDVTLDLNGFTLSCRRNTLPATPCSSVAGTGRGILMAGQNIRIQNGTIRHMADDAVVAAAGSTYLLDAIRARESLRGFRAQTGSQGQVVNSLLSSARIEDAIAMFVDSSLESAGFSFSGSYVVGVDNVLLETAPHYHHGCAFFTGGNTC